MPYTPIVATLGYVMSQDGQSVLMIHRNARPDDIHYGKYNGLGGKLDPMEDVVTGMRREIQEEAGITVEAMTLRGTVNWPGFGKNGEDWLAFIFLITAWQGKPFSSNPEGILEWVSVERILSGELHLWESDRLWLPMVFEKTERTFYGVAPYVDGEMVGWSYSII